MKIECWGTRGSIPVAGSDYQRFGGNTTCFEIISECLPPNQKLFIDAGSGFVQAGYKYLNQVNDGLEFYIWFTHYHWDHVIGLTLNPITFFDTVPMHLLGPCDWKKGPEEMISHLFQRPHFPVDASSFRNKMHFTALRNFDVHVFVVHPKGGFKSLSLDRYKKHLVDDSQVNFGTKKGSYYLDECLIIKMTEANHANAECVCYRFEENPTGKTAAILTDHEDMVMIPAKLRANIANVNVLIQDVQYDQKRYEKATAGYGHGTALGAIKHAIVSNAKLIGFTHHDPRSTDDFLENVILQEAYQSLRRIQEDKCMLNGLRPEVISLTPEQIFLCRDYQTIEV